MGTMSNIVLKTYVAYTYFVKNNIKYMLNIF